MDKIQDPSGMDELGMLDRLAMMFGACDPGGGEAA